MRNHPATPKPDDRRRSTAHPTGFTLVEILVVVGIIILMTSLLIVSVGGMFGTAKTKATRATIEKVNALIGSRMAAVDVALEKGELRNAHQMHAAMLGEAAAKAKVRKQAFLAAFPQAFAETGGKLTAKPGHNPATESSECLYWALTEGGSFGAASIGLDQFTANEVRDTDGDGLLEFVDAWEQPLRFYRWPTRFIRPEGATTAIDAQRVGMLIEGLPANELGFDPDDPAATLAQKIGIDDFEDEYHTAGTYHTPLLVSGGADLQTGLREPTDFSTSDNHAADTGFGYLAHPKEAVLSAADPGDTTLADNITNRRRLGSE